MGRARARRVRGCPFLTGTPRHQFPSRSHPSSWMTSEPAAFTGEAKIPSPPRSSRTLASSPRFSLTFKGGPCFATATSYGLADVAELFEFADPTKAASLCAARLSSHRNHQNGWSGPDRLSAEELVLADAVQLRSSFRSQADSGGCEHRDGLLTCTACNGSPIEDIGALPEEWNWLEGWIETPGCGDTKSRAFHTRRPMVRTVAGRGLR